MKVIGVVGQNGSGKDEVVKYLRDRYGVPLLSSGDMVRELAAKEGKEPTRAVLGEISDRYFKKYGRGYFMKLIAGRIKEEGGKAAGITGIRAPEDVNALKQAFGPDFTLVHVFVSDPRTRYARMQRRGEGRDPQSYEQFLEQEQAEEKLFHISQAIQEAEYNLSNDGTLEDLHREIEEMIKEKGLLNG